MNMTKGRVQQRSTTFFAVHVAVIEARPGETNEEAWRRHLQQNPQDRQATVKIFNRLAADSSERQGQFPQA